MSITKGPWKWSDDHKGNRWGRTGLEPCVISGTVEGLIDISDEDAALIEAAPDLYEALLGMMHCHRNAHDKEGEAAFEKAKAAINKVEGELYK